MSLKTIWRDTPRTVYHAIYEAHQGMLSVHESCTRMDEPGGPYMLTSWGFKDADAPLIKCVRRGDEYRYFIAVTLSCHEEGRN